MKEESTLSSHRMRKSLLYSSRSQSKNVPITIILSQKQIQQSSSQQNRVILSKVAQTSRNNQLKQDFTGLASMKLNNYIKKAQSIIQQNQTQNTRQSFSSVTNENNPQNYQVWSQTMSKYAAPADNLLHSSRNKVLLTQSNDPYQNRSANCVFKNEPLRQVSLVYKQSNIDVLSPLQKHNLLFKLERNSQLVDGPLQMTQSRHQFQSEENYGLFHRVYGHQETEIDYRSSNPPLNTIVDQEEDIENSRHRDNMRSCQSRPRSSYFNYARHAANQDQESYLRKSSQQVAKKDSQSPQIKNQKPRYSNQAKQKKVDESVLSIDNADLCDTVVMDDDNLSSLQTMKSLGVYGSNNIFTQKFSITEILGQQIQKGRNQINISHRSGSQSMSILNNMTQQLHLTQKLAQIIPEQHIPHEQSQTTVTQNTTREEISSQTGKLINSSTTSFIFTPKYYKPQQASQSNHRRSGTQAKKH